MESAQQHLKSDNAAASLKLCVQENGECAKQSLSRGVTCSMQCGDRYENHEL
jgi:hypothetical protein